jgi:hypothetical protein
VGYVKHRTEGSGIKGASSALEAGCRHSSHRPLCLPVSRSDRVRREEGRGPAGFCEADGRRAGRARESRSERFPPASCARPGLNLTRRIYLSVFHPPSQPTLPSVLPRAFASTSYRQRVLLLKVSAASAHRRFPGRGQRCDCRPTQTSNAVRLARADPDCRGRRGTSRGTWGRISRQETGTVGR